jgi:hypothetical protein
VDLTATDGGLTILFRLVGPVPTTGTTMWSVFARPPGGANMQFGARPEGDTRSPLVYHVGDRIQQDLPPETMLVGTDTIEVADPAQAVGRLRAPFDRRAESTTLDDDRLPFTA